MFPAARLLDPVTHDQLVPSGMIAVPLPGPPPNVIIEGMASAAVGDFVACTGVVTGGIVHPPQTGAPPLFLPPPPFMPIVSGSPTVLVNNRPAGRWVADKAGCGVFLGDAKMIPTRSVVIGG